jgi:hypothetical protein
VQGAWLHKLERLESVDLLTTSGFLAFDLRGLPATVREVRLHAAELEGTLSGEHRLRTLECRSGRALELVIEASSEGAGGGAGSDQVCTCRPARTTL